jgi:UDP-N-acetylmuramate--alanine ligase
MDCYRDLRDVEQTFLAFMDLVPFYGIIVACMDDANLRNLLPKVRRRVLTYGTRTDAGFRITNQSYAPGNGEHLSFSSFHVLYRGADLGEFRLRVPGAHNVLNATAAVAVGMGLDVPVERIREALEQFNGADRRFQFKGRVNGVTLIDDYGHHPTEIRATLAAARQCGFERVHVIFQPHRYSRTRLLMDDFATAFADADSLVLLDIYPASEAPIPGVTSQVLADRISRNGPAQLAQAASLEEAAQLACEFAQPGDMILTLGAGNVSHLGAVILQRLANHAIAKTTA